MKKKGTINNALLTRWIYYILILSVMTGMIYRFSGMRIMRISYMGIRVFLLCVVLLEITLTFAAKPIIHKDSLLLLLFVCWELYVSKKNGLLFFPETFVDVLLWPGLFIAFKEESKKRSFKEEIKQPTIYSMCSFVMLSLLLIYKHRTGQGNAGGVVFYTYYCVSFLPLLVYSVDDRRIVNRLFIIIIVVLAVSTKRAGAIVAVTGFAIHLLSDLEVSKVIKNKIENYFAYIIAGLVLIVAFAIVSRIFNIAIWNRIKNTVSDQGSGRIFIWNYVLRAFESSSNIDKLIGHGYQAVYYKLKPFGVDRLAHNSYLEFLYDYGYIGLALFMMFLISMFKRGLRAFKEKNEQLPSMLISMLVCLVFGATSYLFEESAVFSPIALYWGCYVGDENRIRHSRMEQL